MKASPFFAAAGGAVIVASAASGGVTGLELVNFDPPEDWISNGFDPGALDVWRVYVNFDSEADQLNAVFGNGDRPMTIVSSNGEFSNDGAFDSLTAPIDLTGIGIWSNQWDTYATIDTTTNAGDATGLTPGFNEQVNGFDGSFSTDNAAWFVTPDDAPQGNADGFSVLIGQFVVDEGVTISGSLNVQLAGGEQYLNLPLIPAPGAFALLGIAGVVRRRRART